MLTLRKCSELNSLIRSNNNFFEQFKDPTSMASQPFFMWKTADAAENLPAPSSFTGNHQQSFWTGPVYPATNQKHEFNYAEQFAPRYQSYQPSPPLNQSQFQPVFTPLQTKTARFPKKTARRKETLWQQFKRVYITEVIAFTMSKSTLFTLIFSFMFLGCIFFLSGFFAATKIYQTHETTQERSKTHEPTETAMLQGRPERIVNMTTGVGYAAPKAYQYQGGVKIDQNSRRPSQYVENQIAANNPNYR